MGISTQKHLTQQDGIVGMELIKSQDDSLILSGYSVSMDGFGLDGPEPSMLEYPAYAIIQELASQGLAGSPGGEARVLNTDFMAYAAREEEPFRVFNDLGLPDLYTGSVYIEAASALGTPEGSIKVRFPNSVTPSGPNGDNRLILDGILLVNKSEGVQYTCHPDIFNVLKAVEAYNEALSSGKSKDEILLLVAKITKLAEKAQAHLGPILASEKILEAGKIHLSIEEVDGEVSLVPQIKVEGLPGGSFGTKFKKRLDVPAVVNFDGHSEGRIRVALSNKKRKAIDKIKREYQKMRDPDRFRKLLENPPLEFDEAEVDVSALYSERVKKLGIYRPKTWPFICPYETEWIPGIMLEENGVKTPITIRTAADIQRLEEAVMAADKAGRDYAEIDGCKVNIEVARKTLEAARAKKDGTFQDAKQASEKLTLIIEENIELLEYSEDSGSEYLKEPEIDVPGLARDITLKDYQRQGVARLFALYNEKYPGVLVADDMGLGKTIQALSFLETLGHSHQGVFACIVAPKSLVGNWISEYRKYFPEGVLLLENAMGHPELIQRLRSQKSMPRNLIILFSYDTLRIRQLDLCALRWDVAILDEAQRIKTVGTLVTNAAKALNARFKVAMTGTPVENTFHDLWCIADFSLPGFLGSARNFANEYNPSPQDGEPEIRRKGDLLRNRLGKRFLRRIKEDVLKDLPPKYESDDPSHEVKFNGLKSVNIMPDPQRGAYDGVITAYKTRRDLSVLQGRRGMLDILHKLKRACEHPNFVLTDQDNISELSFEDSAKTLSLVEILERVRMSKEKAIVFSEYRRTQRFLATVIHEVFGIRPEIVNGDTPAGADAEAFDGSRLGIVKKFNEKEGFDVIIMSPIAAGVGLNVTGANHVIHFSRHWNPAKEDQATDRAYRIGQSKPVYVYYLIARHPRPEIRSFDDNLARLLAEKRSLRGAVLYPAGLREVKPEDVFNASMEEIG